MLIKKFEADTMAAALKKVKDTLGPEALVLSTRTLGKKGLGVLGRQTIEITAAIESPAMKTPPRSAATAPQTVPQSRKQSPVLGRSTVSNRVETLDDEVVTLSRSMTPAAPSAPTAPSSSSLQLEEEVRQLRAQLDSQSISHLQSEIEQLKELMGQLTHAQAQSRAPQPVAAAQTAAKVVVREAAQMVSHIKNSTDQPLDMLLEILQERGIDRDAATTIAKYAAPRMTQQQRLDPDMQREFLSTTLAGLVQASGPLWLPGQPQKKVSLIGATGVGKTTTIAKLAAQAMTVSGARVALVTIDTYRIAAVEQLKVYGEIMGIPVEVVFTPEQLQETFRRHRDKDLILIDTAGRSPKDHAQIDELNSFLGRHSGVENCLVLAAPTDDRLQQKCCDAFSKLSISKLIFTKLDEADHCGSLINLPLRNNIEIACLTNGQKVPEDLLTAEPQLVADMVMGLYHEARRIAV